MATTRSRRRVVHAPTNHVAPRRSAWRTATSPTAKALYVAVGTAGLAALAIAVFGPKRFQREILQPVRGVVGDQAERLWSDARPLREQIGRLFESAGSGPGRDRLVRSFQSWVGHFRAT